MTKTSLRQSITLVPLAREKNRTSGAVFSLAQQWRKTPQPEFLPGRVRLWWTPSELKLTAVLSGRNIASRSTAHNQPMWRLGDTFEIFLQARGQSDYAELHITPNNHRLHLAVPGPESTSPLSPAFVAFEEMRVTPAGFSSVVRRNANAWSIRAAMPPALAGFDLFQPGEQFRISFARYDAGQSLDPVLSTSSPHSRLAFHRPDEWSTVRLSAGH